MASTSPVKKAYVDTPSGQLHYRYATPATPNGETLIFLHKSASSSVSWVPLMTHYVGKGYTCYATDMPGFGGSFDPSEADISAISEKGTLWYVELFMGAFRTLDIVGGAGARPFHVIGHHSGASLATQMGALYPESVASVALVGASVMSAADRARMKEKYFAPFNKPVADGSHLLKTWDYLRGMGVGDDLDAYQVEAVDHIRAWRGRNQIYGAIWNQDKEHLIKEIKVPVVAMCARDDVLWDYFDNISRLRPDIKRVEVKGANFSPTRDVEGIIAAWTPLIESSKK